MKGKNPRVSRRLAEDLKLKSVTSAVIQGELITVKVTSPIKAEPRDKERGQIKGFSDSARLRMFHFIHSMDWKRFLPAVFVTLTYPDDLSVHDCEQRRRHKANFMRSLETGLDREVCGLWRCEWKQRKSGNRVGEVAPHLHLMIGKTAYIMKERIKQWWCNTLSEPDEVITWIEKVNDARKLSIYLAKYIAKKEERTVLDVASYPHRFGRNWGMMRKSKIPRCPREEIEKLAVDEIEWLFDRGRQLLKNMPEGTDSGFSLFGFRAKKIIAEFERFRLTGECTVG